MDPLPAGNGRAGEGGRRAAGAAAGPSPLHNIRLSIYLDVMPSYDFRCHGCGTTYETRLSMSAYDRGEGRECPECGSTEVERAFTAVNVIAGSRGGGGDACCRPSSGFT